MTWKMKSERGRVKIECVPTFFLRRRWMNFTPKLDTRKWRQLIQCDRLKLTYFRCDNSIHIYIRDIYDLVFVFFTIGPTASHARSLSSRCLIFQSPRWPGEFLMRFSFWWNLHFFWFFAFLLFMLYFIDLSCSLLFKGVFRWIRIWRKIFSKKKSPMTLMLSKKFQSPLSPSRSPSLSSFCFSSWRFASADMQPLEKRRRLTTMFRLSCRLFTETTMSSTLIGDKFLKFVCCSFGLLLLLFFNVVRTMDLLSALHVF